MSKTRAIKLTEARSTFSALVNDIYRTHDRVIVEKSGIPVAAIVSVADLERLDRFEREADNAIAAVRAKKRSGTAERKAS